jgi:hypothetical protein
VAPERKRSAQDYEQALRRQELAAGRALVQALGGEGAPGAEGAPGPRELAAARRVLTQSLFELRRLGRDLDQEIETLRSRKPGAAGAARPAAQRSNPGELERLEAVREAVEEVAERWEGRRDQLSAELERRQPGQGQGQGRQGRRPGAEGAQGARGARQSAAPRPARRDREVRNRGAAAPARPGRPRSPRSRRSPG